MKLETRDVDFYYGDNKILSNISMQANSGEFIGLIGPNGSGKTTLLRLISSVLLPDKGAVFIDEENVSSLTRREIARRMAMVPQEASTNFEFSALDIVLMGRNPWLGRFDFEKEKDLRMAERCMRMTKCWQFASKLISQLSGGEKQRVLIARALTQEPEILLLDEPTANLDISYQIEIMELIKGLCANGKMLVISAIHDLNLAARYCDRLVMLNDGEIHEIGKIEDVLTTSNIRKVFGIDALVERQPAIDSYYVIPFKTGCYE